MSLEIVIIVVGILFLIVEAFIPLFGLWGLFGLSLVITGTLISLNESLLDYGWGVVFAFSLASALVIGGGVYAAFRAYRQKTQTGKRGMIGSTARVLDWVDNQGRVFIDGESWHAVSDKTLVLEKDDVVEIVDIDSLSLTVIPSNDT